MHELGQYTQLVILFSSELSWALSKLIESPSPSNSCILCHHLYVYHHCFSNNPVSRMYYKIPTSSLHVPASWSHASSAKMMVDTIIASPFNVICSATLTSIVPSSSLHPPHLLQSECAVNFYIMIPICLKLLLLCTVLRFQTSSISSLTLYTQFSLLSCLLSSPFSVYLQPPVYSTSMFSCVLLSSVCLSSAY